MDTKKELGQKMDRSEKTCPITFSAPYRFFLQVYQIIDHEKSSMTKRNGSSGLNRNSWMLRQSVWFEPLAFRQKRSPKHATKRSQIGSIRATTIQSRPQDSTRPNPDETLGTLADTQGGTLETDKDILV